MELGDLEVYHGVYKGKDIAVKKCEDAEEGDIIKEARFIHKLQHKNLVKFNAVCVAEKALMLEYVAFDLSAFGIDKKVSGLDVLLAELHKCRFEGFEHLVSHIAKMSYQVFATYTLMESHTEISSPATFWSAVNTFTKFPVKRGKRDLGNCPCIAKLTDFGESWGNICETSQVLKMHTENVFKGTLAFMPPEIIDPQQEAISHKRN